MYKYENTATKYHNALMKMCSRKYDDSDTIRVTRRPVKRENKCMYDSRNTTTHYNGRWNMQFNNDVTRGTNYADYRANGVQ